MLLLCYFALVVAVTDILNVRLGVELLTATVFLAALAISRQIRAFLRDWWFFLIGLLLWNVSGPIAAQSPFPHNLDVLLHFDRALFFGHDPVTVVQHGLADPQRVGILDYLSAVVYNLHLPEPYIAGYVLWRVNRPLYLQFACAALTLLVLGFVTFVLFPAVPPWMASLRFGRLPGVINGFGRVLHAHPLPFHGTPLFLLFKWRGDAVAAFPSEHAAFPLLELLAFSRLALRPLTWLLCAWALIVAFVLVYLGEHWVTDILAGWLYALVIFRFVRRVSKVQGSAARSSVRP